MNFSHRINRLSFSDVPGGAQTLDGDKQITTHGTRLCTRERVEEPHACVNADVGCRQKTAMLAPSCLDSPYSLPCLAAMVAGQEMFQYYLKIVATHTQNLRQKEPLISNQYSVHESVSRWFREKR